MRRVSPVFFRAAAAVTLSFCAAACSSTPRGWRKAAASRTAPSHPVAGAWEGEWRSAGTGHHGRLRCVAERIGPAPEKAPSPGVKRAGAGGSGKGGGAGSAAEEWEFRYGATWAVILRGGYTVRCAVHPDGKGGWTVEGEKHLGRIFGTFAHTGTVRDGSFRATYDSPMDNGEMIMKRAGRAR